jgi:phosphoribosylglycinamide formyltransferase-1
MFNIIALASGNGSNVQAIIDAIDSGKCPVHFSAIITDNPDAFVLKRAEAADIQTFILKPQPKETTKAYNERLAHLLHVLNADLIVLAGYMRILSPALVHTFEGKIINIHPALLPKHKGLDTHACALAAKDKVHGATVHFVSEGVDDGAIIAQTQVDVKPYDTVDTLRKRVLYREHQLYPQVIAWFAAGKVQLKHNKVYVGDIPCTEQGVMLSF